MKPDEQRILIAANMVAGNFTKPAKDYRDRNIMQIPLLGISKMEYKSTDSNKVDFAIVKDSVGKWYLGKDTVSKAVMDSYMNIYSLLRTDDFKDTTITSFPVPTYTIKINLSGSEPVVINMYRDNGTPAGYIIQVSGKQQLFRFSDGVAAQYIKKVKDFVPDKPKTDTNPDTKKPDIKIKK